MEMLTFSSPGNEDTHFYCHWTNGFRMYTHDYSTDIYKVPKEDVVYRRITWTSATSFSFISQYNLNSFIWPH